MPIFSNGHISPVTDDISLESLPSNLQVQSGHMPAHALELASCWPQILAALQVRCSPDAATVTATVMAHRYTTRQ